MTAYDATGGKPVSAELRAAWIALVQGLTVLRREVHRTIGTEDTAAPGECRPGTREPRSNGAHRQADVNSRGADHPATPAVRPGAAQPGAAQPGAAQPGEPRPGLTQPAQQAQPGTAPPGTSDSSPPNGNRSTPPAGESAPATGPAPVRRSAPSRALPPNGSTPSNPAGPPSKGSSSSKTPDPPPKESVQPNGGAGTPRTSRETGRSGGGAYPGGHPPGDPPVDVRRLVERAQAGEPTAFGLLYDRYFDTVFRFVYYRVNNRQLAEDLTAETFLRALKRIGSFTWQGRDLGAWLVTIARNLVADHFKSGRSRLEVTTGDPLDTDREDRAPEGSPESTVLEHITNVELLRAVQQLNPEQQECIVLRFLHEFSVAETALAMNKNEGAIKALQYRAVRALGRLLADGSEP